MHPASRLAASGTTATGRGWRAGCGTSISGAASGIMAPMLGLAAIANGGRRRPDYDGSPRLIIFLQQRGCRRPPGASCGTFFDLCGAAAGCGTASRKGSVGEQRIRQSQAHKNFIN